MLSYESIWEETSKLPWCVLVTTGRVGSDFFQSLLDGHPEIFVFNGVLKIQDFWESASTTQIIGPLILDDIIDEFIGYYIIKFKSRYDIEERKNELGENRDKSIDIDISEYKNHLKNFLRYQSVTSKNFLRATYLSWAICHKQDIEKKKMFFHHLHHIWRLDSYLADFPNSKILSMTRDPRASYVSGVEHWIKYKSATNHPAHVNFVLNRTIQDSTQIPSLKNDYRVIRLEDLGEKLVLDQFCSWAGISYNDCMKHSTWSGLRWWGDRLSTKKISTNETGFSPTISKNNWQGKIGFIEKSLLNFLLYSRLKWYGYEYKKRSNFLFALPMLFLILIPTRYEWKFFSPEYFILAFKKRKPQWIFAAFYYYFVRVALFYRLFINKILNKKFNLSFFKKDT